MRPNGKDTQTKISRAWLLDFGRGLRAAVGLHEMSQIITSPTLFKVPCTPSYCGEVLIFQDHILPVLDLLSFLEGHKVPDITRDVIGIAVYQEDLNHPLKYAGLRLVAFPLSIYVGDHQACELPHHHQRYWQSPLIVSCFFHEGSAIPVLNLAYLLSGRMGSY